MPNLPTLVARLFDGSDTDTRRVSREIDAIRTRFENQPAGARRARDTRVTNTEGTAVAFQNRDQPKPQQQGTS